jgi:hypothetical protein
LGDVGILMVIFIGIQTIQHMIFEKFGCDFPIGNTAITTLPNPVLNDTLVELRMAVIINNSSKPIHLQDNLEEYISNIKSFEYVVLVFVPIFFFIMLVGLIKLHRIFTWRNYLSHTFADVRLRNTLIGWAIFTGLLKIDFFFLFAYAVQLVPSHLVGYKNIPAFESILVFGSGLVAFLLAIFSARNEHVKTLMIFSTILFGSIGYFGYRLFTFGKPREVTEDPFMVNVFASVT